MTTILIGISVGLGALVVLLLALLVVRWRSDSSMMTTPLTWQLLRGENS